MIGRLMTALRRAIAVSELLEKDTFFLDGWCYKVLCKRLDSVVCETTGSVPRMLQLEAKTIVEIY
jgi:hypothetical protein